MVFWDTAVNNWEKIIQNSLDIQVENNINTTTIQVWHKKNTKKQIEICVHTYNLSFQNVFIIYTY